MTAAVPSFQPANSPSFSISLETVLAALEIHGCKPTPAGNGYTAYCPVHEVDHNGHKPSLSVSAGERQPVLIHCHAGCAHADIMAALNLQPATPLNGKRRIVATYSYRDLQGNEVRQKIRYEPKDFRIRHADASGNWVYKAGPGPAVLYRLPELNRDGDVYFCEGEKDCDRLHSLGFVATCNIEGAAQPNQKVKWRKEYTEQLAGAARVILIPDNDPPGRAHMAAIAQALRGKVGDVRMLTLPGLPEKGDVSDWLNAGHTVEEWRALVEQAGALPSENPVHAREGIYKHPTYPSPLTLSISYCFKTLHQPFIPFITTAPDLVVEDSKHGRMTVIDSAAAQALAEVLHGRLAFCQEALTWHGFVETHWQPITPAQAESLIIKLLYAGTGDCGFRGHYADSVIRILRKGWLTLPDVTAAGSSWIPFTNGLLDPATRTLTPITPDNALIWSLPYAYDPAADCPTIKAWLRQAVEGDEDSVEFLRAWLAALLTGRADLQRFLHLLGAPRTGKGAWIRLATALVGAHNAQVTDLRSLETNRFETAALYGKRLVAITDTSRYGGSVDVLKALTGQDALRLERKHQQQNATFTFAGLVLLASNEALQFTDYTGAVERRRLTVRFDRVVSDEELGLWDAQGGETAVLHREIPGVVNWCLALTRDEVTQRLTHQPARVMAANLEAFRAGNPVANWLMEWCIPDPTAKTQIGDKRPLQKEGRTIFEGADEWLYPHYLTWCQRNGQDFPLSLVRFSSTILDTARVLKVSARKTRYANGVHLDGLRLRGEWEPVFDWSSMKGMMGLCRVEDTQLIESVEYEGNAGKNKIISYTREGKSKNSSLLAQTLLDTLNGTPMTRADLERALTLAHGKAGPALIANTINQLLLSGVIAPIGDKLITQEVLP